VTGQHRLKEVGYQETTHAGSSPALSLRVVDGNGQDPICDVLDRRLPIPRGGRRSKDGWPLDARVRHCQTHNRTRLHRRSGAFSGRGESEVDRLRNTSAIHQVRKLDLDVDAVGVRAGNGHRDTRVVFRREFGKGGNGGNRFFCGHENLEVVGFHGNRCDTSEVRILVIEEKRSVRGTQGVVIERIQKVSNNRVGLVGTRDAAVRRAVAGVGGGGAQVGVHEPNGVVEGEGLSLDAGPRNTP
jgi:hypothetical protein